ncbi:MAG TPA: type II CAAX endopeptidase family protein [Actinomycetota bacterium]
MSTTLERPPKLQRPEGPAASPRLGFIKRHALSAYYVLVFTISLGGILLVLGPDGLFSTGSTASAAIVLVIIGPPVASLLLTALVDGRAGLRELGSRLRRWRVGARWYGVALLTAPLVMGATVFALSLASPEFRPDIVTADDKLGIVVIGIAAGLVGPFLEELGWTGFALPRLRRRYSVLTTGLVMGVLWGAWHFPLFAGDTDPEGVVPSALLVVALLFAWLIPYRVLMVWVYDRTQSVLLMYLMHVPATAFVAISVPSEGVSGIVLVTPVLIWGAVFSMMVAAVAWANGGHLTGRQHAAPTMRSA